MVEHAPGIESVASVERRAAAVQDAPERRGLQPAEFIEAQKALLKDHWDPGNGARGLPRHGSIRRFATACCPTGGLQSWTSIGMRSSAWSRVTTWLPAIS